MLTPQQRDRLSKLGLLKKVTTADKISAEKDGPSAELAGKCVSLSEAIPGTVCSSARGTYYLIRREVDGIYNDNGELMREYKRTFLGAGLAAAPKEFHETLRPIIDAQPERVVYLDIETCGFIGVPLFLVGLMNFEGGKLVVRQLLARNYSEEAPLLASLWQFLQGADALVTFNGKTFDMPMIIDRTIVSGIFNYREPEFHIDLLHEARRRWKGILPNCRLQTLEAHVCGRHRGHDIPSDAIPDIYHDFVRSQEAKDTARQARAVGQMRAIIRHNAIDLITMAELAVHIFQNREPDW